MAMSSAVAWKKCNLYASNIGILFMASRERADGIAHNMGRRSERLRDKGQVVGKGAP